MKVVVVLVVTYILWFDGCQNLSDGTNRRVDVVFIRTTHNGSPQRW